MSAEHLRRLAGSVVMAGFRGLSAAPGTLIHDQLAELHLAGVILFDFDAQSGQPARNIASPAQLAELTAELRSAAGGPLLIAIDQEGGHVARLHPGNGHGTYPSHAELVASQDLAGIQQVAAAMAAELAAGGVNINFAPVVDLNLHPDNPIIGARERAFSGDPAHVTECARAFIRGHRHHGVTCAIKHFPGHGSTRGDTHLQVQDITETFEDQELEPYRELIAAGEADMVMAGHLLHRRVDDRHPASLSESWIEGVLRGELGFEGVVISDDLDMAAVAGGFPLVERVALALHAGVDLLLFGNNLGYDPQRPRRVVEAVVQAVQAGHIDESHLEQHAARVRELTRKGLAQE